MYVVKFVEILHLAKAATGLNFPNDKQMREAMYSDTVHPFIHEEALRMAGLKPDTVVADDDKSHYAIEELIIETAVALWCERDN